MDTNQEILNLPELLSVKDPALARQEAITRAQKLTRQVIDVTANRILDGDPEERIKTGPRAKRIPHLSRAVGLHYSAMTIRMSAVVWRDLVRAEPSDDPVMLNVAHRYAVSQAEQFHAAVSEPRPASTKTIVSARRRFLKLTAFLGFVLAPSLALVGCGSYGIEIADAWIKSVQAEPVLFRSRGNGPFRNHKGLYLVVGLSASLLATGEPDIFSCLKGSTLS